MITCESLIQNVTLLVLRKEDLRANPVTTQASHGHGGPGSSLWDLKLEPSEPEDK